jgi:hypothetical protein
VRGSRSVCGRGAVSVIQKGGFHTRKFTRTPPTHGHPVTLGLANDLVESNQVKSSQIKSNQIKSHQIKSNQIKSTQIKSNQINQINQIKSSQINQINQIKSN